MRRRGRPGRAALSPEGLSALGGGVDAEEGFHGVSGAAGQRARIAHLLGNDRGLGGGGLGCLSGLLRERDHAGGNQQ